MQAHDLVGRSSRWLWVRHIFSNPVALRCDEGTMSCQPVMAHSCRRVKSRLGGRRGCVVRNASAKRPVSRRIELYSECMMKEFVGHHGTITRYSVMWSKYSAFLNVYAVDRPFQRFLAVATLRTVCPALSENVHHWRSKTPIPCVPPTSFESPFLPAVLREGSPVHIS